MSFFIAIMKLNIEYKGLNEIMPYERNPRRNDEGVELVMNSIKEFGFRQPIVIDAAGVIVCGHTRYQAAKRLGLKKVPTTTVDDLTPRQVAMYRLADNKTAEFSGWDYSLLDPELEELEDFFDMDDFGFDMETDDDMDELLDNLFDETEKKEDDTYRITLTFPRSEKVEIDNYVKKVGRDKIAEMILREAKA